MAVLFFDSLGGHKPSPDYSPLWTSFTPRLSDHQKAKHHCSDNGKQKKEQNSPNQLFSQ